MYTTSTYGSSASSSSYGYGLPQPAPARHERISYFVPGYGISRHIMMHHVRYYVGANHTIRPFSFQQREGFLLTHDGPPLTKVNNAHTQRERSLTTLQSQIEDLQELSRQFEQREAERMMTRSAEICSERLFINLPIPVQQRRQYQSDSDDYPPHGRSRR